MKKYKSVLLIVLVLSMILSACSSGSNDPTSSSSKPTSEQSDQSQGDVDTPEEIEITLMHRYLSANIGKQSEDTAVLTRIEDFKADFPNVEIIEEQLQASEYDTKAQTLAAANNMPDVFTVPGAWMENFVNNDVVLDLSSYFKENEDVFNGYRVGSFDKATLQDGIYGFPVAAGPTHLLFYNKKLLSEVGYDELPDTWDGLFDLCDKLSQKGIIPFAFANRAGNHAQYAWLSSISDRYTGSEWTQSIVDGSGASFLDQPFVDAISLLNQMKDNGYFNVDLNSIDGDLMVQYYFDEQAAMFSDGIWTVQNVVANAPEAVLESTSVGLFPGVEGGKGNARSSAGGAGVYYCINGNIDPNSEKFDAIINMLNYMTGQGSAEIMASVGGFPAYDPGEFDRSKLHRLANEAYDICNEAPATKIFDLWFDASVVQVMHTSLQEMLAGSKEPSQVAQDMQTEYERYLNR